MANDKTAMWRAVQERDRASDGRFVYAVRTTGIYCRPSCPSRRPNKDNVEYFDTADEACRAGYRACSRCRPEESRSKTEMIVEKLKGYIDQNIDESLTLEKMSTAVGVSKFHLQRLFKKETGMTPRQYVGESRLAAVKQELSAGRPVTEALYEAGYGSSSRLYERSSSQLGMSPGSYKKGGAGELLHYAFIDCELGLMIMAATERGLAFLQFGKNREELKEALEAEFFAATLTESAAPLAAWIEGVEEYFQGRRQEIDLPVDMKGTTFQKSVWSYLRRIPAGQTRTYSQVAAAIGRPRAVRAVASACASNRIAMAIPCHRVVRQDGSMGGYRWGVERKEALLAREKDDQQ